jgi:hypothetical protein
MRSVKHGVALAAALGCAGVALGVASGTATAASCPSEQTVLPYNGMDPPFQCAQMENSGNKSIGSLDTKSWSKTISFGYPVESHCKYRSDSDVSVIESWATSSYTATATNWDTGGTRHFAAGVLFTTGNVNSSSYSNGCNSDGKIENSIVKISDLKLDNKPSTLRQFQTYTINVEVSPSNATGSVALYIADTFITYADVVDGKATLEWTQTGGNTTTKAYVFYTGDNSKCPSRNKSCGFSPFQTNKWDVTIVNDGAAQPASAQTAARRAPDSGRAATTSRVRQDAQATGPDDSAATTAGRRLGPNFRLATLQTTKRMPARLSRRCPRGNVLVNAEVLTDSSKRDPLVIATRRGASVRAESRLRGVSTTLQITCRRQNAPRLVSGRLGYGTPRADRIATAAKSAAIFGGLGADRMTVRHVNGTAFGGPGDDTILVRAGSGVAVGGPGDDRLTSTARGRSLLVGRSGRDTLIGSPRGATRLNAADGRAGDVVVCRGSSNLVVADRGDRVRGSCAQVRRA